MNPTCFWPTKKQSQQMSAEMISRLDRQLWILANLLILVLGAGLLSFMLPAALWFGQGLGVEVPERACYGLCVLLALTPAYLLQKQARLRRLLNQSLLHNAFHDTLTNLPNRALFLDRLSRALSRSKRQLDHQFALLFMDLDHFKMVNDSMGHPAGNQLLVETAQRLQACLRNTDTVARLGGDEFAILLDDITQIDDVPRTLERIRKQLQLPLHVDGREVYVSASIGVALSSTGYDHADDLLRDADTAMYRAKALGPGHHAIFDASMHEHAVKVLELETDLRRAVERQELRLHYQPIVSLVTGQIAGLEALVRWRHVDRGLLAPTEFIPFAERTQLIIPITHWVLQEACGQLRRWQTRFPTNFPLSISVNLTTKYLAEPDCPKEIASLVAEHGLAPENLILEITESEIMEDPEAVSASLSHLSAHGVRVHIDDFGTGYSSLGYLARLPVHALKIARPFVHTMNGDDKNSSIVRSVISLAHNLGLEVVAEGVETIDQLNYLRGVNCQYAQGFYFSPPVDPEKVAPLLLPPSQANMEVKLA